MWLGIIGALIVLHAWFGGKMFWVRCVEHEWYMQCDDTWYFLLILKWMFLWPILIYLEKRKENK